MVRLSHNELSCRMVEIERLEHQLAVREQEMQRLREQVSSGFIAPSSI